MEVSKFVERPLFDGIVTGLILLNTVVLSMYYYGMGEELVFILDTLNAVSPPYASSILIIMKKKIDKISK